MFRSLLARLFWSQTPAAKASPPAAPAVVHPSPLLSLPDELIQHIVTFLKTPSYSDETRDESTSLASACRRLRKIVLPLKWKAVHINSDCPRFSLFVNALRRHGALVRTLSVSIWARSDGNGPTRSMGDCVGIVTKWFPHCSGLLDLTLSVRVYDFIETRDEHFERLYRELGRIGQTLVSLDVKTYNAASNEATVRVMHELLQNTPNLRRLNQGLERGAIAVRLGNLQRLSSLKVLSARRGIDPTPPFPALRRLQVVHLDYAGLQLIAQCFGASLVSLEVVHFDNRHTPEQAPPVHFRHLEEVAFDLGRFDWPLFTYIHRSTPITTIRFKNSIGGFARDLTAFLTSHRRHAILRRIVVAQRDCDFVGAKEFVDHLAGPKRREKIRGRAEYEYHIRLRQFRDWAATKGIEVVAPWYREDLGSSEIPEGFKGYELAMDA